MGWSTVEQERREARNEEIRALAERGYTHERIAAFIGVSRSTVTWVLAQDRKGGKG